MKRNAKALQAKAKKHTVEPLGGGQFKVTSASSGNEYLVTDLANGGLHCTCDWGTKRRSDFQPCSHCLAVEEYLENAGARSLSFWATPEDAAKQHRPVRRVGSGLWATSRV